MVNPVRTSAIAILALAALLTSTTTLAQNATHISAEDIALSLAMADDDAVLMSCPGGMSVVAETVGYACYRSFGNERLARLKIDLATTIQEDVLPVRPWEQEDPDMPFDYTRWFMMSDTAGETQVFGTHILQAEEFQHVVIVTTQRPVDDDPDEEE